MDRFTQAILGYKEEVVVASGGQTFVAATFLSIPANVCLIRLLPHCLTDLYDRTAALFNVSFLHSNHDKLIEARRRWR